MAQLTPLIREVQNSVPQSCPRCGSFFLAQNTCESCGYCLDQYKDLDFYSFKNDYRDKLSTLGQQFPIFESKNSKIFRRYTHQMNKRALYIFEVFSGKEKMDATFPSLFLELSQIIKEMKSYQLDLSLLRNQLLKSPLRFYREATSELFFEQTVLNEVDLFIFEKRRRVKAFVMYLVMAFILMFVAYELLLRFNS